MPKRPLSVSIIAFFVLFQAALNFLSLWVARSNPQVLSQAVNIQNADLERAIPIAMFACAIVGLIGIGLLRGLNWARIAVVALAILAATMGVMQGNPVMLVSAIIHVLMAILLYRPAASAFFEFKRRGGGQPPSLPGSGQGPDAPGGGSAGNSSIQV